MEPITFGNVLEKSKPTASNDLKVFEGWKGDATNNEKNKIDRENIFSKKKIKKIRKIK
jgi:hypothetical protein